jgi:spermidine/putrescine transport system permease protein
MVFFLAPLFVLFIYSFWVVENYRIVVDPGLRNYTKIISGEIYYSVAIRTIRIALVVTVLSLLIGYPVAYYLARKVRRFRFTLLMLIIMPLWISFLVRTFAWALVLGRNGVINQALQVIGLTDGPLEWLLYSEFAVTIALIHIYMPFMVLPIYAVLERFDGTLLEAARDMGASKLRAFLTVTLPLSMPGVIAGTIFVFVPAIGAYVTPELLGGTDGMMFGNLIAQQFGATFEYPFGSALTVVMIAFVATIISIGLRYGRLGRT